MDLAGPFTVDAQGLTDRTRRSENLVLRFEAVDPNARVDARCSRSEEEEALATVRSDVRIRWVRAEKRPIGPVSIVHWVLRLDLGDDPLPVADLQGLALQLDRHVQRRPVEELVHDAHLLFGYISNG